MARRPCWARRQRRWRSPAADSQGTSSGTRGGLSVGRHGRPGLQWSPRGAAAAWFIPVVNLCLPYLVVREIWRTSAEPKEARLIAWWGAWVAGLLLGLLSQVTYLYSGPVLLFPLLGDLIGTVGNVALLIAGAVAIVVIRSITTHQDVQAHRMAVAVPRYEIGVAASPSGWSRP